MGQLRFESSAGRMTEHARRAARRTVNAALANTSPSTRSNCCAKQPGGHRVTSEDGRPTSAGRKVEVQTAKPAAPDKALLSCASPQHEAIEALRWGRGLMAAGTARPEEIAIAAASPAELDDHMLALRRETNLPMHFVHGVKAVSERDGQAAAALAEIIVKDLSQERVRRLFRLLHDRAPALAGLPSDFR
jgi:hypothetical protein